jgi:hypothetical protein
MASNKNQHFVPKVYLRSFSCDPDRAAINLFNITQKRSIARASIKGQCSSNYFYGEDKQLDDALQGSEGFYGLFLKELEKPDFKPETGHLEFLRHFCFLQHSRTAAQAQRTFNFMVSMANAAFDGKPPEDYVPNVKESVRMGMKAFSEHVYAIHDLKVRLVRNHTGIDFVSSDNPSVHTNRWHLQSPKARGKSPGVSSAGVIFFMPITPRILCVVYDGDVYTTDHHDNWIELKRAADVLALNDQQYLNCQANIYFTNWETRADIASAYDLCAGLRPERRHEVIVAVLESEDAPGQTFKVVPQDQMRTGEATTGMVHVKEIFSKPAAWPGFLRIRNSPTIYTNNTGTGFVRAWSLRQGRYSGTGYHKLK